MSFTYDLLLKGGKVVDPSQAIEERLDVGFRDGKVAALAKQLPRDAASCVVDATGMLIVPGLIDMHGHFAHRISPYGADPDLTCLGTGVGTGVDAGSVGWACFPAFRSYVIERADTRLFAFLHLSSLGTIPVASGVPDLADLRFAKIDEAIRCIEGNRDVIVGVKIRLGPTGAPLETAVPALKMARRLAAETRTRVMVHVMESPIPLSTVFEYLEPGDIATHIFQGTDHNILDERGRVRPQVWNAYETGVLFDTACFMRHFSIPICRAALEQGLFPHSLSTDWVGPWMNIKNYNLLEVMSLFLELGMPLNEVIRSVTAAPAGVLGRLDLATLRVGSEGDAAVCRDAIRHRPVLRQLPSQRRPAERVRRV